jgi:uncharacterized protein YbjT (DUF2867 family)
MKTALLAGASGLVGKQLMYKLLESDSYAEVKALVRKPMHLSHPKLKQVEVDFDHLEEYQNELLADDVFCCLGTTIGKAGSQEAFYKVDFTYCHTLAKLSKANGAKQFLLVSAIGADPKSSVFYSRVKGELEMALEQLHFESLQLFQPSLLMGNRLEFRLGEKIGIGIAKVIAPLMFGPIAKYRPIEVVQVANAMLKAAQKTMRTPIVRYQYTEMQ